MLAARPPRLIAPKSAGGAVLLGPAWLGPALLCIMLQGCAKPEAPPAQAAASPLPPHAGPPPAAHCSVAPFTVKDGGNADVVMTVSSEGGYCAATLLTEEGVPFAAPLVRVVPLHGINRIVPYNGKTSVEYAPQPGFTGHDSFIVKLIIRDKPGYTTLNMSVTVR